jgi:hypothetical protein
MNSPNFEFTSDLPVTPEAFLSSLTLAGVNRELGPMIRMSAPAQWRDRPISEWPEERELFKSWIFLFGALPIDRHSFRLRSVVPGRGFSEASSSLVMKHWGHRRFVAGIEGGCRVTDAVEFDTRIPLLGHVLKPLYWLAFRLRHRNLARLYGTVRAP